MRATLTRCYSPIVEDEALLATDGEILLQHAGCHHMGGPAPCLDDRPPRVPSCRNSCYVVIETLARGDT